MSTAQKPKAAFVPYKRKNEAFGEAQQHQTKQVPRLGKGAQSIVTDIFIIMDQEHIRTCCGTGDMTWTVISPGPEVRNESPCFQSYPSEQSNILNVSSVRKHITRHSARHELVPTRPTVLCNQLADVPGLAGRIAADVNNTSCTTALQVCQQGRTHACPRWVCHHNIWPGQSFQLCGDVLCCQIMLQEGCIADRVAMSIEPSISDSPTCNSEQAHSASRPVDVQAVHHSRPSRLRFSMIAPDTCAPLM